MFVNKIGYQHLEMGTNCQDYGFEALNCKLVCDGCSEGLHSEVGAKLFCHLRGCGYWINSAFRKIYDIIGDNPKHIKDYMCFTILQVISYIDKWKVNYCGDGYIILQDINGNITFEELSDGEYPKYFAYNFCPPEVLIHYEKGVDMETKTYSTEEYKNVGVASDGIRFIVNSDNEELRNEFIEILKTGKAVKMKRFINRNQKLFKDDVTIAF